jgi:hypothetical protein
MVRVSEVAFDLCACACAFGLGFSLYVYMYVCRMELDENQD